MTPVCVYPSSQVRQAQKLREHCLDLDGTMIRLIEQTPEDDAKIWIAYPENRFHSLQAHALHRASLELGTDFLWLECDSIPIRSGWMQSLQIEYWKALDAGKSFLLSSDSHPPHDVVGGIGSTPRIPVSWCQRISKRAAGICG